VDVEFVDGLGVEDEADAGFPEPCCEVTPRVECCRLPDMEEKDALAGELDESAAPLFNGDDGTKAPDQFPDKRLEVTMVEDTGRSDSSEVDMVLLIGDPDDDWLKREVFP
jgi:hypothetical protein